MQALFVAQKRGRLFVTRRSSVRWAKTKPGLTISPGFIQSSVAGYGSGMNPPFISDCESSRA